MRIYFLSSEPCALRLNGVFFGVTDKFERFADVSLRDNLFVEFLPEGGLPLTFFLTENIRFSPPQGCEVYLLKNAIAVYACDFTPTDTTLRTIAQSRFENCLVTVFKQGSLQVSVETDETFFTSTLPPSFAACEILFHGGLILLKGQNRLAVYTKTGERVLLEEILSFSVEENVLRARLPLSDSRHRVADCAWELSESGCTRTEFTIKQPQVSEGETPEGLLSYAFFESVLIGANYVDFLSDELQPEAERIVSFLGDFEAVILTDNPNVCGLVKRKGERLFEAAYFTVEIEEGKIIDIKG